MNHRKLLPLFSSLLPFLIAVFAGCGGDENVTKPSNLVLSVNVSSDGSGIVSFQATADNAKYFEYYTGDNGETPFRSQNGNLSHIYSASGSYTVEVTAHANENVFISESQEIEVELFVYIPPTGYSTPENYDGMTLVWADEFQDESVDESYWTFEIGDGCPQLCGWGNNELEFYKKENTQILDGHLVIEARREQAGSRAYTSSRIITKNKFSVQYGRVDVRAVMPRGQGLWPAIWMLGENIDAVSWPACGEIDIMEMIGGDNRESIVHGTVHWDNNGSHASYGGSHTLSTGTLADEFHVFSIVWDETKIVWYIDDIQYHIIDITPAGLSEFRAPFFFIMNVAVGGNWPGAPHGNTFFPQRMIVDYIRVFQEE